MPKCFNCQEKGHIVSQCPQPKKAPFCTACKKEGHKARECASTGSTSSTNKNTVAMINRIYSIDEPAYKYFKTVPFNDISVPETMVGPGCKVTLVGASTAIKFFASFKPSTAKILGVGYLDVGSDVLGETYTSIVIDNVKLDSVLVLVVANNILPAVAICRLFFYRAP